MQLTIDIDGKMATLHTRPTAKIMTTMPALEGTRRWLKLGGLRVEASEHNIQILREIYDSLDVVDLSTAVGAGVASEVEMDRPPYKSLSSPYDHQKTAMAKARPIIFGERGFALFMEQGTGKTKVTIDLAGELWSAGKIDALLVMAKNGVHRQWVRSEMGKHFGGNWKGEFWPTPKKQIPETLLKKGKLKVFSINWDGAKTKFGHAACLEFVQAHKGRVLVVGDETHEIKNTTSARWKAAKQIANAAGKPSYRMALTGTPVAKNLTDEWAQLQWLDEKIVGIRYISAFRNKYCIMGGFEGREVLAHKNLGEFRERVDPFTFRVTKDEMGIAPKAYRQWAFDLTVPQQKQLRELKTTLETQIDNGEILTAANAAVALTKMQQISNGFAVNNDKEIVPFLGKNPRITALKEVLDAYEGPTIVWVRFVHDAILIQEMLDGAGETYVSYGRGVSPKQRDINVETFLGGGARIFLSNPQAGGTGLNLQGGGCRHAIYYSNGYSSIDRWQSEDRIHRIGTTGSCVYTDLVAAKSVDAGILGNLQKKKGILDMAVGEIREMLKDI